VCDEGGKRGVVETSSDSGPVGELFGLPQAIRKIRDDHTRRKSSSHQDDDIGNSLEMHFWSGEVVAGGGSAHLKELAITKGAFGLLTYRVALSICRFEERGAS